MAAITRTAQAEWQGTGKEGKGALTSKSGVLSASPVIHLDPATPTRNAPANAENRMLICARAVNCAISSPSPDP